MQLQQRLGCSFLNTYSIFVVSGLLYLSQDAGTSASISGSHTNIFGPFQGASSGSLTRSFLNPSPSNGILDIIHHDPISRGTLLKDHHGSINFLGEQFADIPLKAQELGNAIKGNFNQRADSEDIATRACQDDNGVSETCLLRIKNPSQQKEVSAVTRHQLNKPNSQSSVATEEHLNKTNSSCSGGKWFSNGQARKSVDPTDTSSMSCNAEKKESDVPVQTFSKVEFAFQLQPESDNHQNAISKTKNPTCLDDLSVPQNVLSGGSNVNEQTMCKAKQDPISMIKKSFMNLGQKISKEIQTKGQEFFESSGKTCSSDADVDVHWRNSNDRACATSDKFLTSCPSEEADKRKLFENFETPCSHNNLPTKSLHKTDNGNAKSNPSANGEDLNVDDPSVSGQKWTNNRENPVPTWDPQKRLDDKSSTKGHGILSYPTKDKWVEYEAKPTSVPKPTVDHSQPQHKLVSSGTMDMLPDEAEKYWRYEIDDSENKFNKAQKELHWKPDKDTKTNQNTSYDPSKPKEVFENFEVQPKLPDHVENEKEKQTELSNGSDEIVNGKVTLPASVENTETERKGNPQDHDRSMLLPTSNSQKGNSTRIYSDTESLVPSYDKDLEKNDSESFVDNRDGAYINSLKDNFASPKDDSENRDYGKRHDLDVIPIRGTSSGGNINFDFAEVPMNTIKQKTNFDELEVPLQRTWDSHSQADEPTYNNKKHDYLKLYPNVSESREFHPREVNYDGFIHSNETSNTQVPAASAESAVSHRNGPASSGEVEKNDRFGPQEKEELLKKLMDVMAFHPDIHGAHHHQSPDHHERMEIIKRIVEVFGIESLKIVNTPYGRCLCELRNHPA